MTPNTIIILGITCGFLAIGTAILIINFQRIERQKTELANEIKQINANALIISLAGTLAAPHLTEKIGREEAEHMVNMWIPTARNIVMNYRHE